MKNILIILLLSTQMFSQTNLLTKQNEYLEKIYYWDQHVRKSKYNCSDKEIAYTDSINEIKLNYYLKLFGFPLTRQYSETAYNGVFYTIQHADLSVQEKYISKIKQIADSGFIAMKKYAMMYDRILHRTIGKQKYGEQRYHDTIDNYLKYVPFINIDSVQIYRKQIGLDSLDLSKRVKLMVK